MLMRLAAKSLWNRRATAFLTVCSLAISVALILGINHIQREAKHGFTSTVSGTDLIVGPRTGQLHLLMYSIFHHGSPSNNIRWSSYQTLSEHPSVAWTVPLSLGDAHKGYRVIGTTTGFFEHYRFRDKESLAFAQGMPFAEVHDAVLGAAVARALGYGLDSAIILSHGLSKQSFSRHDNQPFRVSGILKPTGTPVDQSVLVSLEGLEAVHLGWETGAPPSAGSAVSAEVALRRDLQPEAITAFLVGLESRMAVFALQQEIGSFPDEPLMGVLPGVALSQLWSIVGTVENVFYLISGLVLLASLAGMMTMLLASLNERRPEIALLRIIGAPASFIVLLVQAEALLLAALAVVMGYGLLSVALVLLAPWLAEHYGLLMKPVVSPAQVGMLGGGMLLLAAACAAIPSWLAYRGGD